MFLGITIVVDPVCCDDEISSDNVLSSKYFVLSLLTPINSFHFSFSKNSCRFSDKYSLVFIGLVVCCARRMLLVDYLPFSAILIGWTKVLNGGPA